MTKGKRPRVLIVDDEPDAITPLKLELAEFLDVTVKEPGAVENRDLQRASLVLVDYRITDWPARASAPELALKPRDGLALASVLRSNLLQAGSTSPTAFALLSGRLRDLAGGLPPVFREHSIARSHDLEWVFAKQESLGRPPLTTQVNALAQAVRRLPAVWPQDDPGEVISRVSRLLGLRRTDRWYDRAWEDMEKCHPPFHELATASHGLSFLRWLLHRILPYPCFLIGTSYLAARLYVTPRSLTEALAADKGLRLKLRPIRYSGVLSDFGGERWWRSGVEDLIWRLTRGKPFDRASLQKGAASLSGQLIIIELGHPVVCVDDRFIPSEELRDIGDAVEIQPDDWPPYADRAWARLAEVRENPSLGALVVRRERERVSGIQEGAPATHG